MKPYIQVSKDDNQNERRYLNTASLLAILLFTLFLCSMIVGNGYAESDVIADYASDGLTYTSCDDVQESCVIFNSKNLDEMTLPDFPFSEPGWLITYEEAGNNLQIAYNWTDQTAKYRVSHFGEYLEWNDMATNLGVLLEGSLTALPGCDLNDVIRQNKFYLLVDSEEYTNLPDDSLNAGYLQIQYSSGWTLQTFYHLTDNRIWKRSFAGDEVKAPGWVLCNSDEDISRLEAYIDGLDLTANQDALLEGSPTALPSCDLNDVIRHNKFYLLIDSEEYSNLPDDSLYSGFLQVQYSSGWTLQTFYHLSDNRIWKRSFAGDEVKAPGWVLCCSDDTVYEITQNINRDSIYNTYIIPTNPTITTDENGWLQAIDDESTDESIITDMTGAIMYMLKSTGYCHLGPGIFYVSGNIDLPAGATLEGCGYNTVIRLLPTVESGYIVRILQNNTVRSIRFSGGNSAPVNLFSDGMNYGSKNGIVFTGNADGKEEYRSAALTNIITDCWFENFDGSGIYGHNTGGGIQNTMTMSDCFIDRCRIGLNIDYFMEYSKFANCIITNCYYACINNGGNNVFTGCTFHGVIGWMCDNLANDKNNNMHGSCVGCTFNHIDNMNRPDIVGRGSAVVILNSNNGYIFTGCQFWYGNIIIENSRAITFSDCLFGNSDPVISVSGDDWGAFFHGITFYNEPVLNVNDKTRFLDCYTSDGTLVRPKHTS